MFMENSGGTRVLVCWKTFFAVLWTGTHYKVLILISKFLKAQKVPSSKLYFWVLLEYIYIIIIKKSITYFSHTVHFCCRSFHILLETLYIYI